MTSFNSVQREAIHYPIDRGHLLILAGAGSGKTAVLVHRIQFLIQQGVKRIWCMTFTRQAALEMRERFGALMKDQEFGGSTVELKTFHIFARDILTESGTSIPEELDQWIPEATQQLKGQNETSSIGAPSFELLSIIPEVLLVDEFQDINPEQLAFCQALNPKHLFAVGDDDQAIYGFRGSTVEAILSLEQYFQPLHTLYLTYNYRSHQQILDLANRLFPYKMTHRKSLVSGKKLTHPLDISTEAPQWRKFKQSQECNLWIIKRLKYYQNAGVPYSEIALLVRLNQLVQYYEELLEDYQIPSSHLYHTGVKVMSIHASKGLQFRVVFLCDLNEMIFPHQEHFTLPENTTPDWQEQRFAEEERLFYVAITRAESRLYLLHCKKRVWRGQLTQMKPSPFFKLKYQRGFSMVMFLKIKCVIAVILYMIGRMVLYIPVVFMCTKSKETWVLKHTKSWSAFVLKQLNFKLNIKQADLLNKVPERHLFVVSNHLSWADIPSLLFALPFNLGFVAKIELTRIPILHYWMRQIGCIFVDRKKHREAMRALHALEKNDQYTRIVLFPEGTRSKNGKIGSFKPGGLKIAWTLGAIVQPIHLSGTRNSWEARTNTSEGEGTLKVLPTMDLKAIRKQGVSFDQFLNTLETLFKQENKDFD